MIQTTLFKYFHYNNEAIKQPTYTIQLLKQANLKDYFSIKPTKNKRKANKKKTIIDYFKREEANPVFDLVLVDIKNTTKNDIKCVKKNMFDEALKYIAISYRWGELDEQLVKTPDYTAHITSFRLDELNRLCDLIKRETDLKEIQYIWIDAISVNQLDTERKKETILQMSKIYKRASYILAVPDFHLKYLKKNPANYDVLELIEKYSETIYKDILNNSALSSVIEAKKKKEEEKEKDRNIINAYKFLAYLVVDWSNRAWVISEYHIAKEKIGTPLKYIFMSVFSHLLPSYEEITFFSYSFEHHHHTHVKKTRNNTTTAYSAVCNGYGFIQFLKTRFTKRPHLDLLLHSNATKNEDRFNAILPSWKKYNYLIKDRNTISNWKISNMASTRLKLYEIIDDLDDKARLLYACSQFKHKQPILPTFATHYDGYYLRLIEKEADDFAYEKYTKILLDYVSKTNGNRKNCEDEIKNYKMTFGSIYTDNLISIQLHQHQRYHDYPYLSIKSKKHFSIIDMEFKIDQAFLSSYLLIDNDDGSLQLIFIPFFTFTIPTYIHVPPLYNASGIYLLGNTDINRWIVIPRRMFRISSHQYLPCHDICTFNIY